MVMRWRSFLADNELDRGGGDQGPDVSRYRPGPVKMAGDDPVPRGLEMKKRRHDVAVFCCANRLAVSAASDLLGLCDRKITITITGNTELPGVALDTPGLRAGALQRLDMCAGIVGAAYCGGHFTVGHFSGMGRGNRNQCHQYGGGYCRS